MQAAKLLPSSSDIKISPAKIPNMLNCFFARFKSFPAISANQQILMSTIKML